METATSSYETTPQIQPGIWALGAKGGLYTGLVLIIISLVILLAGIHGDQYASTISSIISYIVGIYLTHQAFKDQGNGFMTYTQGLGLGSVVGLVSATLSTIFMIIYTTFIDTTLQENQLEAARVQLEERGMSDAEIEQAMQFSEMFISPFAMFFMGILSGLFIGFIIALIVSAFTKNTDPTVEY